jgi:chemotaxis signal transduction protein
MNSESKQWFCLFHGEAGPMAVTVDSVAEILRTDTLVRLAWSPPQVAGLCSYHRDVVPVVDLGSLTCDDGDDGSRNQDQAVVTDTPVANTRIAQTDGCTVLILTTEHGVWGLRVDRETTIIGQACPEYHAPRVCANGSVLTGVVRFGETSYAILDPEATWHGLRSAVAAWCRLESDSDGSSPPLRETSR